MSINVKVKDWIKSLINTMKDFPDFFVADINSNIIILKF